MAGIALMAVCAWLGEAGMNNRMCYFPMAFMLAATLSSLIMTVRDKIGLIGRGAAVWGDYFQLFFALTMFLLAVVLVIEAVGTFRRQAERKS